MEYKVIQKADARELSVQVTQHLNDSWRLYGPPYTAKKGMEKYVYHCQAVTKGVIREDISRFPNQNS